jgi:hypothetical protein
MAREYCPVLCLLPASGALAPLILPLLITQEC